MIPQNIVLGEKKGRAFDEPESWRGDIQKQYFVEP